MRSGSIFRRFLIALVITDDAGDRHSRKREVQRDHRGHEGWRCAVCAWAWDRTTSPSRTGARTGIALHRSASAASELAAGLIFFAYIGFDAVSTTAQEAKNPQRDLPIGIIVSLVYLHAALHRRRGGSDRAWCHGSAVNIEAPICAGLSRSQLAWASNIVTIGALAGLTR